MVMPTTLFLSPTTAPPRRRPLTQIIQATLLLAAALAVLSWASWRVVRTESVPELQRKAAAVAATLSREIVRANDLGILPGQLVGMADFLNEAVQPHAEFHFAAFSDASGRVLHASHGLDDAVLPAALGGPVEFRGLLLASYRVESNGRVLGLLHIGIDAAHFADRLTGLVFGLGAPLMAALLAALESLLILVVLRGGAMAATVRRTFAHHRG